jgi:urease accessory protein
MSEELPRATSVLAAGSWPAHSAAEHLVLPYDERHRRRLRYVTQGGTAFLLDLAHAVVLRGGDGLVLEDGRIIAVDAACEPLLRITAPDTATLMRLAWHLGNRHLPAHIAGDHLLIRDDPVIADMLRGLGATVLPVEQPFTPEPGAYQDHGHRLAPPPPAPAGLEGIHDWR